MKLTLGIVSVLLAISPALAQAPAGAPAGSTGQCKDGSYWTGTSKQGACRGHKGVQTWFASAAAAPASPVPATPAASKPMAAAPAPAPAKVAAPTGGTGQVWVNTASKVYHCPGDRYYGKTKAGSYMTEAAAVAAGDHPDHGKACH